MSILVANKVNRDTSDHLFFGGSLESERHIIGPYSGHEV